MMDALPPSDAGRLLELERRIDTLERSNKLLASSIKGGSMVVFNSSGVVVAAIGELPPDGNGIVYTGIRLYDADGSLPILQADQTNGFGVPWLSTGWRTFGAAVTVTSGTFVTTHATLSELLYSTQLLCRVGVTVDAGSTAEIRMFHSATAAQLGSVKALGDGSSAVYEYRMTHAQTIGTGPHEFQLQARRVSGAGNVFVFQPGPLHYGSNMATVAGGWV